MTRCLCSILIVVAAYTSLISSECIPKSKPETYRFPAGFKWSTATAAYQIEGATRADGRGPSIWDEFVRKLGKIRDNSTADVSSDSYHNYKEDVKLMKALGISHYRFSFSWSRIFPQGVGSVNPKGVQYYHDLIDVLLENDIKPMVTLYHWDLPQSLQDLGGWLNRDIVKWFRLYAVYCFKEYGSRVKYWLTLNEPNTQVHQGYCGVGGEHAPGGFQEHCAWTQYLAGHHMLLAHAHAYRSYHGLFTETKGKVGMANSVSWAEADDGASAEFVDEVRQWFVGWFTHPLFEGDYPPAMKAAVEKNSKAELRASSRLPQFTAYERELLKGSVDFLGVNYYITSMVRPFKQGEKSHLAAIDIDIDGVGRLSEKDMPVGRKDSWLSSHPSGLRAVLNYIRENYNNPEMFITENGCIDTPGEGDADVTRMRYLRDHIAAVSKAITDGCNVVGYTLWSLIDNFEWADGYTNLFGIHKVDFTSPARTRTPKASAKLYADIVHNNSVTLTEDCKWSTKQVWTKKKD